VPAGYPLTVHAATDVTVAGTTIDGWDIYGWLNIKAPNVTVTNTRVHCASTGECVHTYADGLRMTRVDIGPDVTNPNPDYAGIAIMDGAGASAVATRNIYRGINAHNTGDGLRCDGGFTLVDSWVHNLGFGGGLHGDGCQATNTGNMLFTGNRIDGGNTSVFLIQSNPSGIVINNNLLTCVSASGEQTSYITNVGPSVPQGGVVFSNNTLAGSCQAGWDGSSSVYQWNSSNWFGNTSGGSVVPAP
jgi:hypothetical protein